MYGMIATWAMAFEGMTASHRILRDNGTAGDAVECAIKAVEDFEFYKSVGYGGLPNEEMEVELDAAYMDGSTLDVGAVGALKHFANPICVARRLSREKVNNVLVSDGAAKFATCEGFECKNMLNERARIHYHNQCKEGNAQGIIPYRGHDTVGIVALDRNANIVVGTSTSGLFMKKRGRIGDSPICGSGFYADAKAGGASATGLGEDLMKGCASYEVVRLMREGYTPQEACEITVTRLDFELRERRGTSGDLSLVAMNNQGTWGAATNITGFSFVVAVPDGITVYLTQKFRGKCRHEPASQEWLAEYMQKRTAPLVRE